MATAHSLIHLKHTSAVVSLLEFCLRCLLLGDSLDIQELPSLKELCGDTDVVTQYFGNSEREQKLNQLARRCQAQAIILQSHLKCGDGQLEHFHGNTNFPHTEELLFCSSDVKFWLVDVLGDASAPFNGYLEAIKKDADDVFSARSREIVKLRREILSILGLPDDDVAQRLLKKRSRKIRHERLLNSSESSAEESDKKSKTLRRPSTYRPKRKQLKKPSTHSAVTSTATVLLWLTPLNNKLVTLLKLAKTLPLEIRLLTQLSFESVNSREDSIRGAESGTFQWLLNDSVDTELTQDMALAKESFISWLNSGSGVFHISGNAGSGKSTLMKFIRHHQRTRAELELWAANRKLVFSDFYFWNSGNSMQMSLEGLCRSILLEVSRQCPNLIPILFPDYWESLVSGDLPLVNDFSDPEQIQMAFERLRSMRGDSEYRMCFFIDGLDEFTGGNIDYKTLAMDLQDWSQSSAVKLCVSARPYPEFLDTFSSDLRFHLHELTSHDLEAFASDSLRSITKLELSPDEMDVLLQTLLRGSEGVFVWMRIVIRSLLSLTNRGLTIPQLLETAERYPSDINELYEFLLGSLEPEERKRSDQMLSLAVNNPFSQPLNALCFSWFDELDNLSFPKSNSPYSVGEVKIRHEAARNEIEWLTKGLLEMHTDRRERKKGDQFYRQRVQLFHRTARDFLRLPGHQTSSVSTETYATLRLAEIVLAGKYRIAPGADPRRRRLYSNLLRSFFNLRDQPGTRYQILHRLLLTLEVDLKVTVDDTRFSGPYAISHLQSISNDATDEDPEKAASFLHLATSYGQQDYVIKELQENSQTSTDKRELSLILSAIFGHRKWSLTQFEILLSHLPASTTKIKVRPSFGDDPFASSSFEASVQMVFASAVIYRCLRSHPQKHIQNVKLLEYKDCQELLASLVLFLKSAARRQIQDEDQAEIPSPLDDFICILQKKDPVETNSEKPVFITTISQLVMRFSDDNSMTLSDNKMRQQVTQMSQVDLHHLPAWTEIPLKQRFAHEEALFVPHHLLGDYICTQVISETESISAVDNMFFRVY